VLRVIIYNPNSHVFVCDYMYGLRSFHNLRHNANLSVYCWLVTLERHLKADKTLPDTIYYQVGGQAYNVL